MGTLPTAIVRVLRPFEGAFSDRVRAWAQVLLAGALLAPGQRTVAAALRTLGLSSEAFFRDYPRGLNRARWSRRALSRSRLRPLARAVVADGAPVVVGLGDAIERRRGAKIAAKGI